MTKTILYVCNEYPPFPSGGIGTFVKHLAEALVKKDYRCIVVGMYNVAAVQEEQIEGVQVFRYPRKKVVGLFQGIRQSLLDKKSLSHYIQHLEREFKPNWIESYEWSGPLFKKPITPLIVRLHGSHTVHARAQHKKVSSWIAYWERRNYHMADKLVAVSHYILATSEHRFKKAKAKSCVIYNGVSTEFFSPGNTVSQSSDELLFAGRFHEQKGVYELPALLKELFALSSNYQFVFVGHHTEAQQQEFLSKFNTEHQQRIRFISGLHQAGLLPYYRRAAVVLVPSRGEAFGLVSAEAMSCAALVAMNNTSSATELIEDKENGLLIDMKRAAASAKKIHDYIVDTEGNKRIRAAARKKVEQCFAQHLVLAQNEKLYELT